MLPPWWLLAALVVVLTAVGVAAARAGRDGDIARPLCALGVLALPYLPWLPDRLPVLRVAAGPARGMLWLAVLGLIAVPSLSRLRSRLRIPQSPSVIFLASAIIFAMAAWRLTGTAFFPGGDEPHYLVITQSLLEDRDLRIENNHRQGDYHAYYRGDLKPDYLTRGADGEIYSIHPIGLSVLAIPAFALGGYRGVVAMLVLMAALAASLLWQWARELTGSVQAATFAWAAAALTAPYLFNAFAVYPEIPAALAVMVAVGWRAESAAAGVMALRGVAIGALPWLSTKYAPMAAAVAIVVLLRTRWKPRAIAATMGPIAVAITGWFAFFFWVWGTISPSAPYGASETMTPAYLAHGGAGLLFDQEYGIIAQAPILVVAFAGLTRMLRSGGTAARLALEVTVIFGALLVTVGAFHVWWGGSAAAGRPVASGVLLLGVPIASLFASTAARPAARAGCHVLLATSLAIACALAVAQGGALLHNDRDGSAALLEWASPTWPLAPAFPSFIAPPLAVAIERTLAWLVAGTAIAWMVRLFRPRAYGGAVLTTLMLGFAGAVTLTSFSSAARAVPAALGPERRARVPLLDRFDAVRRPTTVLYDPLSRISNADALSRVTLIARPGLRTAPQPLDLLWNARVALPAGEYRLRLTRGGAAPAADTTLALQIGRAGPPVERWDVAGHLWEHRFVLPLDAEFVGFRAPPLLSKSDGELRLTPVRVVDQAKRLARPPIIGAMRQGMVTAFFHDDNVFGEPSGYWTRGGASAQVTYATSADSPATIEVMVHCGPVRNDVTLTTPGWEERLAIEPGISRHVAIPTTAEPDLDARVAPLQIAVQNGFVPAQADRAATDRRFLGCWIETVRD